jgi:small GTP-binding protein
MFEGRPQRTSEIIFVGRSNVGKSTLMRKITGHAFKTGKKPGVTRKPNFYDHPQQNFLITDLPGFGFMSGLEKKTQELIKTSIINYVEENSSSFLAAVLILDGNSASDIIDRHFSRGEIPHDIEFYNFLLDMNIPTVIAVNKTDKIKDIDECLNDICDRLGLPEPWQQWSDIVAPISAKKGDIGSLISVLQKLLHESKRDDLLKFFK